MGSTMRKPVVLITGASGEIGHGLIERIAAEGKTLYAMGDTDIMADWEWMAELHKPDCAIVPIGGHFTMDGARAAWGSLRWRRPARCCC